MSLSAVYLTADLQMACFQLAFSTEKEEVIALLLGETKTSADGKEEAHISALMIPRRSDKKKDRVEISDEQLVLAANYATTLSEKLGCKLRVLGWFHSHPHITVIPSHVDVNTQAMYQMMDPSFVGLICSAFSEDKITKENEVQMTCFQSKNIKPDNEPPQYVRVEVPFFVKPPGYPHSNCLETICGLQVILQMEEIESFEAMQTEELDPLTKVHNESVLTKNLHHINETITLPLLNTLEQTERAMKQRIVILKAEKESLEKERLEKERLKKERLEKELS